jgi:hypothetical protein
VCSAAGRDQGQGLTLLLELGALHGGYQVLYAPVLLRQVRRKLLQHAWLTQQRQQQLRLQHLLQARALRKHPLHRAHT